ncbi:hypothetical protein FRC12_019049 [Ceratobasidium sp. 428]|nr:hypothetical protein FRC12_019049 [Ceratobasidium sp. 428]
MRPPRHWESTRDKLANAIQEYEQAYSSLEIMLHMPVHKPFSRIIRSDFFTHVDWEVFTLHLYEERLEELRRRLSVARNTPRAPPPINTLPPEILVKIFSLATQNWINEDYKETDVGQPADGPCDLALVCTLWSRLVLRTPEFWTRISLACAGIISQWSYRRSNAYAKRSQGATLHVNFAGSERLNDIEPEELSESDITRAIEFLTPLMHRVSSLAIYSGKCPADKLINPVLACWAQHSSIGVAKRLEIHGSIAVELPVSRVSPNTPNRLLPPRETSMLLASLQAIRFNNVLFDWGFPLVYSSLTKLLLDFSFQLVPLPTQCDIVNLLASNPGIRLLELYGIRVRPSTTYHAVAMDNLEVLGLQTRHANDLALVLPLVSKASDSVRMALSVGDSPEFTSAVRSFFARIKVTTLHINGPLPNTIESIAPLFTNMPDLRTLAIHSCDISGSILNDLIRHYEVNSNSRDFWPNLRDLYVIRCLTSPHMARQLANIHTLRKLWVYETDLPAENEWNREGAPEEAKAALLERGVDLIWRRTKDRDIAQWSFVYI